MNRIFQIFETHLHIEQQGNLLSIIIGLVVCAGLCFLGYRIGKIWAAVIGFFAGAYLGVFISNTFFDNEVITLLFAVIIGFFVAMLAFHVYAMGLFLFCFFCGACFFAPFAFELFPGNSYIWFFIAGAGLIVAVLGVILLKPVTIIITALVGGFKAAQYLVLILPFERPWLLPALAAFLAVAGALVQFLTTRNYKLSRGGDRISKY